MPIRDATKDEIEALRARLKEKQEQRQLEADINEVIDMVQHRKPSQSVREGCQLPQGGSQGGRAEAAGGVRVGWSVGTVIWLGVHLLRRMGAEEWLFLLALAMIGLVAANLAK